MRELDPLRDLVHDGLPTRPNDNPARPHTCGYGRCNHPNCKNGETR